jgi:hypothetical protein
VGHWLASGITNGVVGLGKTNVQRRSLQGGSVAEVGKQGDDFMKTFDHENVFL